MSEIVFGIDLGTTNSSIAFGKDKGTDSPVHINNIDIKQMVETGAIKPNKTLPSFLYYDNKIIVGGYAREKRKTSPLNVIQSVKLKMGKDHKWEVQGRSFDPVEVSSEYLKLLRKSASNLIQKEVKKAVLAVPASFDNDMRKATLDAAHLAGFEVYDVNGKPFEGILIDEPRAVLYDLLNRQLNGEFPNPVIEKGKKTRILVFDFGGGTLDVSLHDVRIDDNNMLNIDDLSISRYTELGGDTFDQMVADWIKDEFFKQHSNLNWSQLSAFEKQAFNVQALAAAEQLKLDLASASHFDFGWGDNSEPEATLSTGNLYLGYSLTTQVTLQDYENIVGDLLGDIYSLEDYETINQFTEPEERNNIIYPILEVLYKAKENFENGPQIDKVILSGGMTYLSLIRDRIKNLLGIEPIQIQNPETAVSRGAAIYAVYLQRGVKITPILAETISLGLQNGVACELVEAGTVLPHRRQIDQNFILPQDNSSNIYIPLYRGSDSSVANLELIKGFYFDLGRPFPKGTSVDMQISIDRNKIITLKAWLREDPTIQFEGELSFDNKPINQNNKKIHKPETPKIQNRIILTEEIEIEPLLNRYLSSLANNSEKGLGTIEDKIARASNGFMAIDKIWRRYNTNQANPTSVKRLPMFLAKIYKKHPNAQFKRQFLKKLDKEINKDIMVLTSYHKNAMYGVIWAIGELELKNFATPLEYALRKYSDLTNYDISIISLGKVGHTKTNAEFLFELLRRGISSRKIGMSISSMWAIGKIASSQQSNPLPRSVFDEMIPKILQFTEIHLKGRSINMNFTRNSLFALGEIGDSRNGEVWDSPLQKYVLKKIKDFQETLFNKGLDQTIPENKRNQFSQLYGFAETIIKMIKGVEISEDEEQILLAIRSGLEIA